MAKNNKPASAYAGRHKEGLKQGKIQTIDDLNPSAGFYSKSEGKPTKTTGIKIRGTGAATKGTMARGPMG